MSTLRAQLEPFRFVVDENSPWGREICSSKIDLQNEEIEKEQTVEETKETMCCRNARQEPERFAQADREADEWREKEMAKDMANRKVDELMAIEKVKARRERRILEPDLELALIVEEMQELRS